ncbi:hypothetical protein, partial [Brevundimonas sp.]|uniref:hypothetical protein n=1 Tax=Brevundimonas sp. TaxID=1871086 RepID=UPI0028A00B43
AADIREAAAATARHLFRVLAVFIVVAPTRLADAKPSRSVCKILQQWLRLSTRVVFAAMQTL